MSSQSRIIMRSPFLFFASCGFVYVWRIVRLHMAWNNEQHQLAPVTIITEQTQQHVYDGKFSACLLVMDDNHFLIEWLAYHHFVLPLGHVVVAVDPRSRTRPDAILQKWQEYGLDVQLWNDNDYMTSAEQREAEVYVKQHFGPEILEQPDLIVHRARQRIFYYECLKTLKKQGRDWVLLIDTDEYVHINYPTVQSLNLTTAPSMGAPGSIMTFLNSELQRPGHNLSSPCIQIPRIRYGAEESSNIDLQQHSMSSSDYFNASHFLTMRWRKHASPENYAHNRISKTMVDLKRVGWDQLHPVDSVHRPIRKLCGHRRLYIQSKDQVFQINHYIGTWDQYVYRNDSRAGKERSHLAYSVVKNLDEAVDDDVRPWLSGFVQENGVAVAKHLLEGVGELELPV